MCALISRGIKLANYVYMYSSPETGLHSLQLSVWVDAWLYPQGESKSCGIVLKNGFAHTGCASPSGVLLLLDQRLPNDLTHATPLTPCSHNAVLACVVSATVLAGSTDSVKTAAMPYALFMFMVSKVQLNRHTHFFTDRKYM